MSKITLKQYQSLSNLCELAQKQIAHLESEYQKQIEKLTNEITKLDFEKKELEKTLSNQIIVDKGSLCTDLFGENSHYYSDHTTLLRTLEDKSIIENLNIPYSKYHFYRLKYKGVAKFSDLLKSVQEKCQKIIEDKNETIKNLRNRLYSLRESNSMLEEKIEKIREEEKNKKWWGLYPSFIKLFNYLFK